MHQNRRAIEVIFVLTLAALLLGGILFVTGQAIALVAGQGDLLRFFNESVKPPLCIAASVCAVAGFLLSYKSQSQNRKQTRQEAETR